MIRLDSKVLIAAILVVGASFEVAKRLSWVQTAQSPEISAIGKTKRILEPGYSEKTNHLRRRSRPASPSISKTATFQTAMMIPSGQFDSNAGNAGALTKQEKATEKKEKEGEKKCRPKNEPRLAERKPIEFNIVKPKASNEQKPLVQKALLAGQSTVKPDKNSRPEEDEEELEECEDEESQIAKEDLKPAEDVEKQDEPDTATAPAPTFGGGLATNRNQDAGLAGLEEWKARVLDHPNFKETVRLIEAAQSGAISSELFYTIVNLMLKDPRDDMRELGVLAAGRTPSPKSFHLLVEVLKQERFGTKIRQRAEGEIAIYRQVRYLWVLENVLRSSEDAVTVIWAARALEESARQYLNVRYNRPVSTPRSSNGPGTPVDGGGNQTATTRNPYVADYNRFIALLQELSTAKGSVEQMSQAKQTLSSLQALIKAVS